MPDFSNPRAKIDYGKDYNFFYKQTVASPSFNTNCDVLITIPNPTQTVTFQLESSGKVEYSFNGNTVHGDMDSTQASKTLIFENRVICKIWFRLVSGAGTVRVEAWGTR